MFIRFIARAFSKLLSVYVFSYFPFGFEGRISDLIKVLCVWGGGWGGVKPVLRDPNLALSFCYGSKHIVSCSVRMKVF